MKSKDSLKQQLRSCYNSFDELVAQYDSDVAELGTALWLPPGRTFVSMLKEPEASDTIITPEDYTEERVYAYAVARMSDTGEYFVVQVPAYGLVPLGGSVRARSVQHADVYCYWSAAAVKNLLK